MTNNAFIFFTNTQNQNSVTEKAIGQYWFVPASKSCIINI